MHKKKKLFKNVTPEDTIQKYSKDYDVRTDGYQKKRKTIETKYY